MNAKIFLAGDDQLVAELTGGVRLAHVDAVSLSDLHWSKGVTASQVSMVDWHISAARAPTSGRRLRYTNA